VPPTKLYKFAAATVMTIVAAATVVTFSTTGDADSVPVAAGLPAVPGSNAGAPTVGFDQTPESSIGIPDEVTEAQALPSASPEPTTPASRSTKRDTTPTPTTDPKPSPKPSPEPSPTEEPKKNGGLLDFLR
jgi:hypothetical protein